MFTDALVVHAHTLINQETGATRKVWMMTVNWNKYPFVYIDLTGVGHDDRTCAHGTSDECSDSLMARDPWPCKFCVVIPDVRTTQGVSHSESSVAQHRIMTTASERISSVFGSDLST